MFDFNLTSLVAFCPLSGEIKKSNLAGKIFCVFVCFYEICETVNCTFMTELFLPIWIFLFSLFASCVLPALISNLSFSNFFKLNK